MPSWYNNNNRLNLKNNHRENDQVYDQLDSEISNIITFNFDERVTMIMENQEVYLDLSAFQPTHQDRYNVIQLAFDL